jgi:hypothetical protein
VHERYYAGLLGFLGAQRGGPFRLEIPFTDNHWESRWVAPRVPLARGWERQVDRQRNALFYDDRPITAARYRRWLDDNAVRFVALADAPIDYSAAREAALVRRGTPYLREVWHDEHWRVFAVTGARPLASGAARATAVEPEGGHGCVGEGPGGWTRLRVRRPGPVVVEASFALGRVRASAPRCTD